MPASPSSPERRLTVWGLEKERHLGAAGARAAFLGRGGLFVAGRWHRRGTPVVYAGEHPAVAALEKLVWLQSYERARAGRFVLVWLGLDPERHVEVVPRSALPEGWDAFPHPAATQAIGTRWFEEARSVALAVPSAVLPLAWNYLINPLHADFAELEVGEPEAFTWDARLFRRSR